MDKSIYFTKDNDMYIACTRALTPRTDAFPLEIEPEKTPATSVGGKVCTQAIALRILFI